MSKVWQSFKKTLFRNVHGGTGSKHEELRNFQYWPKFLVSYKKHVYALKESKMISYPSVSAHVQAAGCSESIVHCLSNVVKDLVT